MKARGFTLIEILVVIAIVGVLSSIVLVSLNLARENGRVGAGKQFDANVYHALADRAEVSLEFDECSGTAITDSSGNNRGGTVVGSVTWTTSTPSGKGCAIVFDGGTTYIPLSTLNIGTNPVTFSAWVKTPVLSANVEYGLVTVYNPGNAWHFTFERSSWAGGGFTLYAGYGQQTPSSLTASVWPNSDTNWHHVAMTRDSTALRLYFDGRQVAISTSTNFTAYNAGNYQIRIGHPSQTYWPGSIDSLRIYSGTLTADEVHALYAAEVPAHNLALDE